MHLYREARVICHQVLTTLSDLSYFSGENEKNYQEEMEVVKNELSIPEDGKSREQLINTAKAFLVLITKLENASSSSSSSMSIKEAVLNKEEKEERMMTCSESEVDNSLFKVDSLVKELVKEGGDDTVCVIKKVEKEKEQSEVIAILHDSTLSPQLRAIKVGVDGDDDDGLH